MLKNKTAATDTEDAMTPEEQDEAKTLIGAVLDAKLQAAGLVDAEGKGIARPAIPSQEAKGVTIDAKKIATAIKAAAGSEGKNLSFELKNMADLGALSKALSVDGLSGDVILDDRESGATRAPVRQTLIEDLATVRPTSSDAVAYTEVTTETGVPLPTAELAVIPEAGKNYQLVTKPVKKIAVITKHSQEILEDSAELVGVLQEMIEEDVRVASDTQMLTGDGTGENLEGIQTVASVLNAAAIGTQRIANANLFDVLRIAFTKVATAGKGRYVPTAVLLNPVDAEGLDTVKDADGRYILPPFISADGTKVKGVQVIENVGVPAGRFFVGDIRKFQVRNRSYRVDISNSDGNDFSKDIITIKVTRRLVTFLKVNDNASIITGVIADIKAALIAA